MGIGTIPHFAGAEALEGAGLSRGFPLHAVRQSNKWILNAKQDTFIPDSPVVSSVAGVCMNKADELRPASHLCLLVDIHEVVFDRLG